MTATAGPDLVADCSSCAALCCWAFAFEAGQGFGADKAAGQGCAHLGADDRCGIHGDRVARGYDGCLKFDCQGAGQRVTQEIFGGAHWRDHPALTARMIAALAHMRQVHRLYELVDVAGNYPLDPAQRGERDRLLRALHPEAGWTESGLRAFAAGPVPRAVQVFLRGLAGLIAAQGGVSGNIA